MKRRWVLDEKGNVVGVEGEAMVEGEGAKKTTMFDRAWGKYLEVAEEGGGGQPGAMSGGG